MNESAGYHSRIQKGEEKGAGDSKLSYIIIHNDPLV